MQSNIVRAPVRLKEVPAVKTWTAHGLHMDFTATPRPTLPYVLEKFGSSRQPEFGLRTITQMTQFCVAMYITSSQCISYAPPALCNKASVEDGASGNTRVVPKSIGNTNPCLTSHHKKHVLLARRPRHGYMRPTLTFRQRTVARGVASARLEPSTCSWEPSCANPNQHRRKPTHLHNNAHTHHRAVRVCVCVMCVTCV